MTSKADSRWPAIRIAEEVRAAIESGRAVVALESTLIAHGLPRPRNLEVARQLERIVRDGGGVPATIGVIAGRPTVGLSADELEVLATAGGVRKCGRRDLAIVVANGGHGATTVGGTLALMGLTGLRVLATGGIGGVHRGAEATFDVSSDLAELARTPAIAVCAGAKALLDLPRTLEVLETLGVAVLGWRTDELPAFYTARSGLPVVARVDDAAQTARIARAAWELGTGHGLLLAVPPPTGALSAADAERALAESHAAAERGGVRGPSLTPFLLDALARATGGRSVEANIALLENNTCIAAEVAVALASSSLSPR